MGGGGVDPSSHLASQEYTWTGHQSITGPPLMTVGREVKVGEE